jgi:hypothetical protein
MFIERLSHAEFENLWLKISGFGDNATAAGIVKFIHSIRDFQHLNKPIIADNVGGFVGIAALAFGVVGGISHGVAQKERFDLKSWNTNNNWKGGSGTRIYFPDLDLFVSNKQANILFKEKGVKSLLLCKDNKCCSNDMLANPNEHFLTQRFKQINSLNEIPESRRIYYFLEKVLKPALVKMKKLANSNINDEQLKKKVIAHKQKGERIYKALNNINQTKDTNQRAMTPIRSRASSLIKQHRGEAS